MQVFFFPFHAFSLTHVSQHLNKSQQGDHRCNVNNGTIPFRCGRKSYKRAACNSAGCWRTHTHKHTFVRFKNVPQGEWSALWNKTSLNQKHYVPLTNPLGHNIRVLLTCGKKQESNFLNLRKMYLLHPGSVCLSLLVPQLILAALNHLAGFNILSALEINFTVSMHLFLFFH